MMKKAMAIIWTLYLLPAIAIAQTPSREALIDKIENAYFQSTIFSPDSPFIDLYLEGPKKANRDATPEVWSDVKKDLASALTQVALQKGGALDKVFRKSLESLSDLEIARLSEITTDPVFAKFQRAMASPETERVLMTAMANETLRIGHALNIVLAKHGLREVR